MQVSIKVSLILRKNNFVSSGKKNPAGKKSSVDRNVPTNNSVPSGAFRELQRGLTGERSLIGESYMENPQMLRSYLDYYWPVSLEQARYALRFAPHAVGTVIDIGSGPGPVAAAFLDSGTKRAVLVDQSRKALDLALRELPLRCGTGTEKIATFSANISSPDASSIPYWGEADCVSFGHSLNELFAGADDRIERRAALLEKYSHALADGGFILVIEPALLSTSRDLLAVRNLLVERLWRVIAPCPGRETLTCPALAAGESHTCHEEIKWTMPAETAQLAKKLKLDKEVLKMTWFLLEPPQGAGSANTVIAANTVAGANTVNAADTMAGASPHADAARPLDAGLYRVVSDPMLNKAGRVRRLLCGVDGRFPLSVQSGSADESRTGFDRLSRGDCLRVQHPEIRENGWGIAADTKIIKEKISGAR